MCRLLVAHVKVGTEANGSPMIRPFVVKRNPTQQYNKCHTNDKFPRFCDWPVGEMATFELALLLNVRPVVPLILAGTLDNPKVEKVLTQYRKECKAEWRPDHESYPAVKPGWPLSDLYVFIELVKPEHVKLTQQLAMCVDRHSHNRMP